MGALDIITESSPLSAMPAIMEGIVNEGWLKANDADSNGDLVEGAEISLYGQVVHRRRLSSKLLFYDILLTPGPATPGVTSSAEETSSPEMDSVKQAEQGVELMVKASGRTQGRMPLSEVQRLRLDVKLGDIVRAYGVRELCMSSGAPVLHCTRVEVATPWSSLRTGNEQFVPQPHTFWRIPEGTAAAPESVTSSAPGSLKKKTTTFARMQFHNKRSCPKEHEAASRKRCTRRAYL